MLLSTSRRYKAFLQSAKVDAKIRRLEIALTALFKVTLRLNVVARMVEDAAPYPVADSPGPL